MHVLRPSILSLGLLLIVQLEHSKAQQYNFRHFNVEDNLVQTQVQALCQDNRGYLWIGTRGGLSAYNGISFINYTVDEGLKGNRVNALCTDTRGQIWIGTDRGLSFAIGNKIVNNDFTNNFHNIYINVIHQDRNQRVWIGTRDQGVYCYNGEQLVNVNRALGLASNTCLSLASERSGRILIGTVNGLNWLDESGIRNLFSGAPQSWQINALSVDDGLTSNRIEAVYADESGSIWLGTNEGGVNVFRIGAKGRRIRDMHHMHKEKVCGIDSIYCSIGLVDESVTTLVQGLRGRIWIGSDKGLSICERSKKNKGYSFTALTTKNGLRNDMISSSLMDREANLWFGTSNGLSMFEGMKFVHLTQADGVSADIATSVYIDQDNAIWVGTLGGGLCKFKSLNSALENNLKIYNSENGFSDIVYAVNQFDEASVFAGVQKDGVYRITDKGNTNYDILSGTSFRMINVIANDRYNNLWLGAWGGGIYVAQEGDPLYVKIMAISKRDGLAGDNVCSMIEDAHGNMWVGAQGGLSRISNQKNLADRVTDGEIPEIMTFNESNGLKCRSVYCLRLDDAGNLWMGTDNGVSYLDLSNPEKYEFIQFTKDDGLTSNDVYVIDFDLDGNLWIGSNRGLDRFNVTLFNKTKETFITHYGKLEGFRGIECVQNASFRDAQGDLWFASNDGVTRYQMEEDKFNQVEAVTRITNIRLFYEDVNWSEMSISVGDSSGLPVSLELPYSQNHLTFDFVGVSLTIPEKVKYRFYLKGLDNDWSPATSKQEAVYSSIPPGNYVFMVMSANNDGIWNKEALKYRFSINPPFWKSWWFIFISLIGGAGALILYLRKRERGILEQRGILEKMVQERTSQLTEKKKEVERQNEEIAKQNKDITGSIQYAKRIQEAILPDRNSLSELIPKSFIFFKPKDIVSGDFYWFKKDGDRVFIAAVDCTGHGVPGAFMSLVANQLLGRIIINNGVEDPGDILKLLHSGIVGALYREENETGTLDGLDMVLCSFNLKESRVDYACGSRPLLRVRDGKSELYRGEKHPIGLVLEEERNFTTHSLDFKPGDRFYIYTDGFSDQFGGANYDKFMSRRFIELLEGLNDVPMKEQQESLANVMKDWIGDKRQIDDMLVIGVGV